MEIIIILFLILLNGVFSMSEMALVSVKKSRLEIDAKKGSSRAKAALQLVEKPNNFLSTVQIGITLIGILTGIFSGDKIATDLKLTIENVPALVPYSSTISVTVILIIITFLTLVFGELLPKRLGLSYPNAIAKAMALPMSFISKITAPFVWLLTKTTDNVLRILNINSANDERVTEEEIRRMIKASTIDGEVQEIEQDIVERVFNIGDRKINSLMTHRKSVVFLQMQDTFQEVKNKVVNEIHSFYPVCQQNMEEVIGIVSLKDIFLMVEKENVDFQSIINEPVFMNEFTSAYHALEIFKSTKNHFALVTDEYGVVQGVLTLNDILEALVGDASEFDEDEYQLTQINDDYWESDGFYPLHDLLTYFDLDEFINQYDVATVSGLVMEELSYIPVNGEKLYWNNLEIEILDSDGNKINKVGIRIINPEQED
ncbi:hemolysin family protein [Avrilella dinanensis]|uniref:Hemolysin n=1 Tax=Avrilella dinanensis TaxID=2008672 RepID=A0A2M9R4F6_9FLAO|nr:hemolysin family protein [Avrilella dinanensis]PJR03748.1 hemolysin [Avrilella dinanensis]